MKSPISRDVWPMITSSGQELESRLERVAETRETIICGMAYAVLKLFKTEYTEDMHRGGDWRDKAQDLFAQMKSSFEFCLENEIIKRPEDKDDVFDRMPHGDRHAFGTWALGDYMCGMAYVCGRERSFPDGRLREPVVFLAAYVYAALSTSPNAKPEETHWSHYERHLWETFENRIERLWLQQS